MIARGLFHEHLHLWAAFIASCFVCVQVVGQARDADCVKQLRVYDTLSYAVRSEGYLTGNEQSRECRWELDASTMFQQNKTIQLQFDVDIEDTSKCDSESVTVYASTSSKNTTLAVLCGRIQNRMYEFFIPNIMVVYRPSPTSLQERKGFKMVFQMIDSKCHKVLDSNDKKFQILKSNLYPRPYPSFQRCTYLIRSGTPNKHPVLNFTFTDIGYNCSEEYILVHDGDSEHSPLLGKVCRFHKPTFRSLMESLYVVFVSHDNSIVYSGFKAQYKDAMCGERLMAGTDQEGVFHFGKAYPINNAITCVWHITAKGDYKVLVSITRLTVDCGRSMITVYDGDDVSSDDASWDVCGKGNNYTYVSTSRHMTIKLNSQGQPAQPVSFLIKYKGVDDKAICGAGLIAETGRERTVQFRKVYPINHAVTCMWHITAKGDYKVLVSITRLAVDCDGSMITVYDDENTDLSNDDASWDICGKGKNYTYMSSGRHMAIKLNSQGNSAQPVSFTIKYKGIANTGCFRNRYTNTGYANVYLTATSDERILTSPGYPDLYPDQIKCVWQIQADHYTSRMDIRVLEMDLHQKPECYDSISIYDGRLWDFTKKPDLIWCTNKMSSFTSSGQFVTVLFSSNEEGIGKGFKIVYKISEDISDYYEGETETATSSNTPVVAIACAVTGLVLVLIVIAYCSKGHFDRTSQPPTMQASQLPDPQGRDATAPFLQTSYPTNPMLPSAPPPPPPEFTDLNPPPPPEFTDFNPPAAPEIPQRRPEAPPPSYEDALRMIEKA
ncbi:cubilin-like [Haliotis rubra]|uniref:cubilin-like n=1 Tax=Haliotis rubra TaxID=36100 RepID=UPI001EE54C45|nr:cubilin-like [Haliotis rubra]